MTDPKRGPPEQGSGPFSLPTLNHPTTVHFQLKMDDLPQEVIGAMRPLVEQWAWLVPTWCHSVRITWGAEDDGSTLMSCSPSADYRQTCLTVYASWLTESPEGRERALVHELIHIQLGHMQDTMSELIASHVPEGAVRNWARQRWISCVEMTVCDIQHALTDERNR